MHFKVQTLLEFVSLFSLVISNAFIGPNWTSYKVDVIQREVNTSIIASSHSTKYFSQCAYKCSRNSSASLYFVANKEECYCNHDVDSTTEDVPETPAIIYGFIKSTEISKPEDITKLGVIPRKTDCLEFYNSGHTEDGVYTIQPAGRPTVDAWCDMVGGGWTVVQRRQDGSEDFYRGLIDYVYGFGNKTGEYWLGLENIRALTSRQSEAVINFEAFEDGDPPSANITFGKFLIYGPNLWYKLHIERYVSSCNKILTYTCPENGMGFSTPDNDNDICPTHSCASSLKGGWWYRDCHEVNINGQYLKGVHSSNADGVNYIPCWGYNYSVRKTVMKVRRL